MSFNIASKINNLASDQDDLERKVEYITSLAPNELNNSSSVANSLGGDPNFALTVANSLSLKADKTTTYSKIDADTKFTNLIDGAPELLNTLGELSKALNDQSNSGSVVLNSLEGKQPLLTDTNLLDPALIGTGIISLTEFSYLNGLTGNIKTSVI